MTAQATRKAVEAPCFRHRSPGPMTSDDPFTGYRPTLAAPLSVGGDS